MSQVTTSIVFILQVRELGHREPKRLAQGHTALQRQSWEPGRRARGPRSAPPRASMESQLAEAAQRAACPAHVLFDRPANLRSLQSQGPLGAPLRRTRSTRALPVTSCLLPRLRGPRSPLRLCSLLVPDGSSLGAGAAHLVPRGAEGADTPTRSG